MKNYPNLNIDLSNCDKEPIQVIGRIQPHGFLFVMNNDLVVEQISSNVPELFKKEAAKILQSNFLTLIQNSEIVQLSEEIQNPQIILLDDVKYFGFLHRTEEKIIVELEQFDELPNDDHLKYNFLFSQLNDRMNVKSTAEEIADSLANYIQEVIDYDRVVVFRFDEEWNAETIAEALNPGIESYLGHFFPASDIPAPARALLEQKHVRQIPSVGATPADIIPYLNPSSDKPTNILKSELRNPSEIHTEYLHNMKVGASLSISIIADNKLWGLISCSNRVPLFIDYWKRDLCNRAAQNFSHIIPSLREKRDLQNFLHLKELEEVMVDQIRKSKSITQGLFNQNLNVLELTSSTGVAIYLDNRLNTIGNTPGDNTISDIIDWLIVNNEKSFFCTTALSKQMSSAKEFTDICSGLLALEISKMNREYLLFFKPEIKATKTWAGNPEKPEMRNDGRIHPRKSFQTWLEVVDGQSENWTKNEIEIVQLLYKDLVAARIKLQAELLEKLYAQLSIKTDDLKLKNNQLEEFNYIVTHNLRAPMVTISSLYSYYEKDPTIEKSTFVMEKMKVVSNNMLSTIEDLNAILEVKINTEKDKEEVSFKEIIDREIQSLEIIISASDASVSIELLQPTIKIPKAYLQSIIHNLLSNALKYSSPKRKPEVILKSWSEGGNVYFSVSDNGLGLDLEKNGDKIFGLYKTFHRHKEAKGLGLYLTKLQIESLGGIITVKSELDKGTTFLVSF